MACGDVVVWWHVACKWWYAFSGAHAKGHVQSTALNGDAVLKTHWTVLVAGHGGDSLYFSQLMLASDSGDIRLTHCCKVDLHLREA